MRRSVIVAGGFFGASLVVNVDLSEAILTFANLKDADLTGANLS